MKRQHYKILLLIWFYCAWFGCVYLAKFGHSVWTFGLAYISWRLLYKAIPFSFKKTFVLLGLAAIGIAFDILASHFNVMHFYGKGYLLPFWLISMWLMYVSILPISTEFFQSRLVLSAILGSIFGPLSYIYGQNFGVVHRTNAFDFVIYGLFWALFFPFGIYSQRKFS